jgi:hypothetical protein
MKTTVIKCLFIILLGTFSVSSIEANNLKPTNYTEQSDYDKGWADGWCEGWKDIKGQYAYCPYTPYPPYPEYSCSEGYRCGYNRGFKYGMCMAQERNCEK